MLFIKIGDIIENYSSTWKPKEIELEKLLISAISKENPLLDEAIFGEPLLFLKNQKQTNSKKRADIVALDKDGHSVIIELKKDQGKLGVETQALQYLSAFSNYTGNDFIKEFAPEMDQSLIEDFLYDDIDIDHVNKYSRIILLARFFDEALFSMGKWLSEQGISFRCITYEPIQIDKQQFLNFSIVFDQISKNNRLKLKFSNIIREPKNFWHIIGSEEITWWSYLIDNQIITASFDNELGDRGEQILKNYIKNDVVFAYMSGKGCVGYGIIENRNYKLIEVGSKEDVFEKRGKHLHRKSIKWISVIKDPENAIKPNELKENFGIPHPIQTSSEIKRGNTKGLIEEINNRKT